LSSGIVVTATALPSPARRCYEAAVRPRFVVVLCIAAWLVALAELLGAVAGVPVDGVPAALLGLRFGGSLGRLLRVLEACALCLGAWGLWNLRSWARTAAMVYLAAVILSFLFLGAGSGRDRAAWTLVWQITIVPFATFCYMFLHNGRRHFGREKPAPNVP
jgi:ABC-type Na+ efflux pump permease subunit